MTRRPGRSSSGTTREIDPAPTICQDPCASCRTPGGSSCRTSRMLPLYVSNVLPNTDRWDPHCGGAHRQSSADPRTKPRHATGSGRISSRARRRHRIGSYMYMQYYCLFASPTHAHARCIARNLLLASMDAGRGARAAHHPRKCRCVAVQRPGYGRQWQRPQRVFDGPHCILHCPHVRSSRSSTAVSRMGNGSRSSSVLFGPTAPSLRRRRLGTARQT